MKKKLILKIILSIVLIASTIFSIYEGIKNTQIIQTFPGGVTVVRNTYIQETICHFLSAALQITFLVFLNFFEVSFFKTSILKEMKERKEATAEERKQKKIEELEKQLDELKKE